MKEITLINITGEDKPGLTASLMAILSQHQVTILDMGQAVIHQSLALGLLVEVPAHNAENPVLKDLLFHLHEQKLQAQFTPVSAESYESWVALHGKPRFIITLLARRITAEHIARVAQLTQRFDLNIEDIQRLSGRISLREEQEDSKGCFE